MLKKILALLCVSAAALSGCARLPEEINSPSAESVTEEYSQDIQEEPAEKKDIKIGAVKGVGSVSIAHLLENSADNSAYENYTAEIYTNANELMNALAKGYVNAAILSPDKAAKLYNEYDFNCRVAAVSSTCNYYILENTDGSQEPADFKALDGREIIINETDKMAEPLLDKISEYNNITLEYKYVDTNDAVIKGLNTPGALALLQEPVCSQAELVNESISVVLDLYDYWQEAADCPLVTSCLVVPADFTENDRETLDLFIKDYGASVSIAKHNMSKTAELVEKYSLFDNKEAVEKAIPGCGIGITTGSDMKEELGKLYSILIELSIDSVGRAIPDDNFYYMQ